MTTLIMQHLVQQEKIAQDYADTLRAIRMGEFTSCDLMDCEFAEYMTPEEVMAEYLTEIDCLDINSGLGFKCTLEYNNAGSTVWVDTVDGTVTCKWGVGLSVRIDDETLGFIIEVLRKRFEILY